MFAGSADIIYILTNFRPGISKPNAFQVPNNCVPLPSNVNLLNLYPDGSFK